MFLIPSGFGYFALLAVFFVSASFFTKFGSEKKGGHSKRGWVNVLANGLFPTVAAVSASPVMFFSSLSAVTADKLAGEIGQLSPKNPVMITDLRKRVPMGTNGGITPLGEAVSAISGGAIGIAAWIAFGGAPFLHYFSTGVACGFFGSNFDSFLGATLENRGFADKHAVNFLASVFGGILGLLIFPK